jgi:hypothetical protein
MNKYHAEYDKAAITPSVGTQAVGRVGGSDDDTFSRQDGSEVRAQAMRAAGGVDARGHRAASERADAANPPRDVLG